MKRRKFTAAAVAAIIGLSSLGLSGFTTPEESDYASDPVKETRKAGALFDPGIANDEKLIAMLKHEGKIAKNASQSDAEKALQTYLKAKAEGAKKGTKDKLPKSIAGFKSSENAVNDSLKSGKGNKLGQAKKNQVDPINKESYDGAVRKDKVLVLAIDFPDDPKSTIDPSETDMYYPDYSHQHFQDMIFGKNGYKGPNGENLVSMKQFYEQQSGGSYTVDGTVAGWYTADHPAAYYGGNDPATDSDQRPRQLIYEALKKAGQDPNINLSDYDVWDRDDYDGDGVYNEPDGIIDHLMVIHSGVGEEAGGGKLGADAIWSHRWNLGGLVAVPGGTSNSDRFGGLLGAYDYTIEPEDGAAGVFSHEFGHDLGLPDEYDTIYSGAGEPIEYWSIMSAGSWAGKIPGTEPSGFSPYAKQYLQNAHGGNWLSGTTINASDITSKGTEVLLDEAATKGTNNDAVRIDLPDKETVVNTPTSGSYEYFSGSGDDLDQSMTKTIDLTNVTDAKLTFKTWYSIEQDWDYASVQVNGKSIPGSITTTNDPNEQNPGNGITGDSNGWVDATFDLSAYTGQKIDLSFNYWTDVAVAQPGFYVDDIKVTADGNAIVTDDAEGTPSFTLNGFKKDQGKFKSKNYYLLEWRSHNGVDEGLAHIRRGASLMSYDPGLVVWYVDDAYSENWTGVHPGDGYLGVVDADQHVNKWSTGALGSSRYQLNDAAFSLDKSNKMFLDYSAIDRSSLKDNFTQRNPLFDDRADYSGASLPDAGRNIPKLGLKARVVGQSADGTVGKVLLYK
ncbi:immune inhibitor A domain-containing protein [Sporolactobacillus kofuensis]|uniref:Immune inhibitor A domain-containing protein n=1 Tax=Sporolactobacillus kofuensis TaxID=269672 RepID=A0ABW1WJH8_9BACL|nr:immune inhibitor A domain-containing protein [Sporolactobacillus kofuensis]MCO7176962.1 immune inhibitor A [Sporolactobacillus kofuensis]